ncbi:MAG: peptide ABC transporter permease [Dehalococcoidales bacterium]|nr:peptide ABC transporter permease [Dehalococcoidales bacterium]MDP6221942.1 ABC transporter permease [Dehalococcoidales bacterium]MDP7409943.1 ABC transporter permease [Dehalococcoidales bacterium]MDP7675422.1 ABC transporter permease [Dehalococcoidales bacterium]HJM36457.1 ABC transporter permease [Dehalococcoidales bacterium]|tara:strand:- start:7380 stop:8324 length:945 start_codon:yes stop_codon:yes gene_type:complete
MTRFFIRRLILIVLTLFVVSIAIFAVTTVLPGDVAQVILGKGATPQDVETLRNELGLNRPAYSQYMGWIGGIVQGDLGDSLYLRRPIAELLQSRLTNSLVLAVFAFFVAIPSAVLVGIWTGTHRDSRTDRVMSTMSMVAISLPEFVTGMLLIVILSSTLHLLPSSSMMLPGTSPLTRPQILIMPAFTLTGVIFGYVMRMTRANVIEVLQCNYVRTAILKGLPMQRVILHHVVPNAILPTITIVAASIGWLLGGLIVVEVVFAYPGLGRLLLGAVETRDVPLLQITTLIIAATFTFSNLAADLLCAALDRRVRLS